MEGANGQEVPYLGYVKLTITFPKAFLGVEAEIPTLALVVPNLRANAQEQVLIGTKTLDTLFSQNKGYSHQPLPYGYCTVLKVLELRH